jgi:hypothetical protein
MMAYAWNPSTKETAANGSQVPGQPGLHSETPLKKIYVYVHIYYILYNTCAYIVFYII